MKEPLRLRAFATDFDGTLAHHGIVPEAALTSLLRLKTAGVKMLMVTGREIEDLARIFARMDVFDMIVAENGGVLYTPQDRIVQRLAEPPPAKFVKRLMARQVGPISVGHCIVATWEPHQEAVLETIRELGLELQIIFNKGAVMILPAGVNKATGLAAALDHLGIKAAETVAVGDAENDHAMLELCGFPAAVANALPALREHAQYVTTAGHGEGVAELIDLLLQPGFTFP